jgi:ADP-ribosyl-[dinitrogen reductase] hydrolase
MNERAIIGCLLGTAVGDALGLPYEGLSARRGARLFPDAGRHHLVLGRGMVSDDTEHACFVAQALIRANGDVGGFTRALGRSLRWWLAGLPAGVGLATGRAIVKLWLGWSPARSGVHSAGNGPAMRSALLGVAFADAPETMEAHVAASTRLTHADPKAFHAALAVARAARHGTVATTVTPDAFLQDLAESVTDAGASELVDLIARARDSAARGESVAAFAAAIGSRNGISGYSYHTVPCVLQVWFRWPDDLGAGLREIIRAGGDTDTAGAIYGGIVGARIGKAGIPPPWLARICEWPRSIAWIERLGHALAAGAPMPPQYFVPGLLLRNALFLAVVLFHGFRRLAPPY